MSLMHLSYSRTFILIFISFALSLNSYAETESETIVLKGATLFDGTGSEPIENGIILINGQRIDCVGTESDCEVASDAEIIDLNGKYITP
ncbi:MAG: hypothetical protein GVY20_13095, partial [Bacteroidetes bacterium]|nr:hypothetical protein [Bacteroidota bacterium]